MVKAYLSGPIIHEELRMDDFYKAVISVLENQGIEIFAPQFGPPTDADTIYQRDTQELRSSDFIIAEVSNPSHGVGMEIMLSIQLSKPILMFRHRTDEKLSKMVLGSDGKALFLYDTIKEVEEILKGRNLAGMQVGRCVKCASRVIEANQGSFRCIACGEELSE